MKYGSFIYCPNRWTRLITLALLFSGLLIWGPLQVAYAATIPVNTTVDELNTNGNCSLREAIRAANLDINVDSCTAGSGSDTITLPSGLYTLAISGQNDNTDATGDLDISSNVTINGAGANTTILDGNKLDRVMDILPGATVIINKVTIQNGLNGFACGAGLHNRGTLTIQSTIIRNNQSDCGGGIFNDILGILTLSQSTVTANKSGTTGGGIYNTAGGSFGAGKLTLTRSTVSGNNGGLAGGGVSDLGTTTVIESTVSGNQAFDGGGLYSEGLLTLTNSTVSGNIANRDGGGILGATSLNNVTVVNNIADNDHNGVGDGGGIIGTAVNLKNTLLANNIDMGGETADCSGTLNSQGYNLIQNSTGCTINGNLSGNWLGVDPLLGPLQNNGGNTETHALVAGSVAIDSGDPAGCSDEAGLLLTIDQRGSPRPVDGNQDNSVRCDIGAYESPATSMPNNTATATATGNATATNTATNTATPTPTATPTNTATATGNATATNTSTATATPMPTPTNTATATATNAATVTNTATPTPTATPPGGDVSTVVQPDQDAGLVYNHTDGSSVNVQIARGAVSQPTTLVYTALDPPQNGPNGFRFTGQAFTLVAYQNNRPLSQFNFQKPITLILTYTNDQVVGVEEAQSMLYFYDAQTAQWSTAGIAVVQRDTDNNRLIVTSTHLTEFATFAPFQPTSFYYLPMILQK